ncbi:hypothetical protein BST61_g7789 [Cercospora zeina]
MVDVSAETEHRPSGPNVKAFPVQLRRGQQHHPNDNLRSAISSRRLHNNNNNNNNNMPQQSGLVANETVRQSPQFIALEGLLTTTVAEANPLQRFCDPVEQKLQSNANDNADDVAEELNIGWKAIITKAAATPHEDNSGGRSALAAFLVSLSQKRADGQQPDSSYGTVHEMKVWQDLPTFGWSVRDAWNFPAEDNSPPEEKQRWINVNAFVATLVDQLQDKANNNPDLSLFAIWTIRDALEEENVSDAALAAASVWFIYAAPALLKFSKDKKSFEGKVAKGGFAHQDAGWTGYSPARWQVWQQRLDSIRGEVKEAETKRLVQAAVDAIGNTKIHYTRSNRS